MKRKQGVRKGHRKYLCGHCGKDSFHHWIEANRAHGITCPLCGSRNMSVVSPEGKAEQAARNRVRVQGGTHYASAFHRESKRRIT